MQCKQRQHLQLLPCCSRSLRGVRQTPACHKLFRKRWMAPAFNQPQGLHCAALNHQHTDTDILITHSTHQKRGAGPAPDFSFSILSQNSPRVCFFFNSVEIKSKGNCFYLSVCLVSVTLFKMFKIIMVFSSTQQTRYLSLKCFNLRSYTVSFRLFSQVETPTTESLTIDCREELLL